MESKFVKIKGNYNIHYLEEGDSENVLILLHGIPVNSSLYKKVIPLLSKNFRVIAPDFIGFGKSDKPLNFEYNLKGYTDMFKSFVNSINLKNFSLGAMDLGLMVAVDYAVNHPKNIKDLILFEGFILPIELGIKNMGLLSRISLSLAKNDKIAQDIFIKNGKNSVKKFINGGLINKLSENELFEYVEQFDNEALRKKVWYEGVGPHTIKKDKVLSETVTKNYEKLKKSSFPILLLHVEPGQTIKVSSIELLKKDIPKLIVKSIGNGKHFLPLDVPEKLTHAILNF